MVTTHLPTPEEVIALFKQSGEMPANNHDFLNSFKVIYPSLTESERNVLLKSLLDYVDSLLQKEVEKAA